jgi:hypothetical protein
MDEHDFSVNEKRLREIALSFDYPPTPDITESVMERLKKPLQARRQPAMRLASRAAIIALLVLLALLAVPSVRAAVIEWIQIGAIRIFLNPTETPVGPLRTIPSLLGLAGETTLSEAKEMVALPIRLPDYPDDLGNPDRVFVQDVGGPVVVLVWTEPEQPDRIRLSLMILGQGSYAGKGQPLLIEKTSVNDSQALWMQGSHFLMLTQEGRSVPDRIMVDSDVLVWEESGVTYRIESNYSLEETIRIAESLR